MSRLRALLAWACVLAFVAVLLGPSLLGRTVFAATDILEVTPPWQASSTWEPEPVNRCVSDTVDGAIPAILETRSRLAAGDLPFLRDAAELPADAGLREVYLALLEDPSLPDLAGAAEPRA